MNFLYILDNCYKLDVPDNRCYTRCAFLHYTGKTLANK